MGFARSARGDGYHVITSSTFWACPQGCNAINDADEFHPAGPNVRSGAEVRSSPRRNWRGALA